MFTGIVSDVGEVREVTPRAEGLKRITIGCRYSRASLVGAMRFTSSALFCGNWAKALR